MALYGPPADLSVCAAVNTIFLHYCSPLKSPLLHQNVTTSTSNGSSKDNSTDGSISTDNTMDGVSFAKLCKDIPGLSKNIGRTDVDLVFTRSKKSGGLRRLSFDNFLDALLQLSMKIYPDDEPTRALSIFLSKYLFSLFDQVPTPQSMQVINMIYNELSNNSVATASL